MARGLKGVNLIQEKTQCFGVIGVMGVKCH